MRLPPTIPYELSMLLAMQMLSAQMMAPQGHCALLELAHTLVNASLSSAVVEVELARA